MQIGSAIAVIGARDCQRELYEKGVNLGTLLAENGYTVICGGLSGIMEAVCKGAQQNGGLTIGILPGDDPDDANQYVRIPIATGMGISRNLIIIRSAQAVIAINGGYGTLSELAFALQLNKPVIGIGTWEISKEIINVKSPEQAINKLNSILR